MADLVLRTALSTIEATLRDAIQFAYKRRLPTVANVSALQALPSRNLADQDLCFVTSSAATWRFVKLSTTTPDGSTVVQPLDTVAGGRWFLTQSTTQGGYLKTVQLYEGEATTEEILSRIIGLRPCVLVRWVSSKHRELSLTRGALYNYQVAFELWAISYNLRPGAQAILGSDVTAEVAADPGANQILGDLKMLLGGNDLSSPPTNQTGISYIELGDESKVIDDLGQRTFVYKLGINVVANVEQFDTVTALTPPDAMQVTYSLQGITGQQAFDPKNYVVAGISVPTGASLTQSVSTGNAYIGGVLVAYSGAAQTFPASSDTYRDLLPNGTLVFSSVPNGTAPPKPPTTDGYLRVGVTVTSASAVTSDTYIAPTLQAATAIAVDQVPNH